MIRALTAGFETGGEALWFGGVVFTTFMLANTLNFAMVAVGSWFAYGVSPRVMLRSFVTALPSEFATALLTASVAVTYGRLGVGSIGARRRGPVRVPVHRPDQHRRG